MALVFDIETIGNEFDSLPESVQEYLLRRAASEEEIQERKRQTSLLPYTGEVICIGCHDTDTGKGGVLFRAGAQPVPEEDGDIHFIATASEKELLEKFWKRAGAARRFVTFNGRAFDIPFLVVRSGITGVKVSRDLMGKRWDNAVHVDLYDTLCFQGATSTRRFNLDLVCRAFGIESPKTAEAHGYKVQEMWEQGRGVDIARYCYGDVRATAALYERWAQFMDV